MRKPLPRWDRLAGAVARRGRRARAASGCSSRRSRPRKGWPARWRAAPRSSPRSNGGRRTSRRGSRRWGRAISDAPFPSALGRSQTPPESRAAAGHVDHRRGRHARAPVDREGRRARVRRRSRRGAVGSPRPGSSSRTRTSSRASARRTVQDSTGRRSPRDGRRVRPGARRRGARVPDARRAAARRCAGARSATSARCTAIRGGGPLAASPARVGDEILAVGTDIYRTGRAARHVLRARGDARARRLGRRARRHARGQVVGMAFAIDPGRSATAYALTDAEITPVLHAVLGRHRAGRHRPLPGRLSDLRTRATVLDGRPRLDGARRVGRATSRLR